MSAVFTDQELLRLRDLLVFELEGRSEHDLPDAPEIDSALDKISAELSGRGIE